MAGEAGVWPRLTDTILPLRLDDDEEGVSTAIDEQQHQLVRPTAEELSKVFDGVNGLTIYFLDHIAMLDVSPGCRA